MCDKACISSIRISMCRLWGYALYDSDFVEFEFSRADTVSLDSVKGPCNIFERRPRRDWKSAPCSCAALVTEVTNKSCRFYGNLKGCRSRYSKVWYLVWRRNLSLSLSLSLSLRLFLYRKMIRCFMGWQDKLIRQPECFSSNTCNVRRLF